MKNSGKKKEAAIDEVEELLKQTQDDLLLNLTLVNSHTKSKLPEPSNSNAIDPDLDRRFQALRSKPNPNPAPKITDLDNLFARFAALNNSPTLDTKIEKDIGTGEVETEEEEDEVQKIINWAIDAARLDPSPSSDIEDLTDSDSDPYPDQADRSAVRKNKGPKK